MQVHEERLVERMWVEFSAGKTITNPVCSDFFFSVIRVQRSLSHLSAFEVLDTIVNFSLPAGHARNNPAHTRKLPLVDTLDTAEPAMAEQEPA